MQVVHHSGLSGPFFGNLCNPEFRIYPKETKETSS
jgi:hypothetical protein